MTVCIDRFEDVKRNNISPTNRTTGLDTLCIYVPMLVFDINVSYVCKYLRTGRPTGGTVLHPSTGTVIHRNVVSFTQPAARLGIIMSVTQVLLFLIVGKNEPLFEAEFHKRGAPGNSDAVARQNYFVVHSALDLVEKAQWTTQSVRWCDGVVCVCRCLQMLTTFFMVCLHVPR
jgi:hypothetical protein